MSYPNFHMDMSGMNMSSSTNSSSSSSSMSMGGTCKISMLWNWTTIDACFLSSTWHVRSHGAFAGSVLGVFFLCMAIEAVRRVAREYDRRLTATARADAATAALTVSAKPETDGRFGRGVPGPVRIGWLQQTVRAFMYGVQFTGAFLVMLLGMYYNGFVLFAIFLGHTIGYLLFAKDTVGDTMIESGCAC